MSRTAGRAINCAGLTFALLRLRAESLYIVAGQDVVRYKTHRVVVAQPEMFLPGCSGDRMIDKQPVS